MIEIRNRFTGAVIHSADAETIKIAVEMAVRSKINLSGTDMSGANMSCANLSYANMSCADLSGADLSRTHLVGADLSGARLGGCIGNGREIKSLQLDTYPITYTADRIQIGCKNHSHAEWWAFTDYEIARMDRAALDWWKRMKEPLRAIIEASPATTTGEEQNDA